MDYRIVIATVIKVNFPIKKLDLKSPDLTAPDYINREYSRIYSTSIAISLRLRKV